MPGASVPLGVLLELGVGARCRAGAQRALDGDRVFGKRAAGRRPCLAGAIHGAVQAAPGLRARAWRATGGRRRAERRALLHEALGEGAARALGPDGLGPYPYRVGVGVDRHHSTPALSRLREARHVGGIDRLQGARCGSGSPAGRLHADLLEGCSRAIGTSSSCCSMAWMYPRRPA